MAEVFIDNAKRKRIVTFWIPVCLAFLHAWASALVIAVVFFDRHNPTIEGMFSTCGWGLAGLIFLLVSDKALEFLISRLGALSAAQVIEKTTTETTVVKPAAPPATTTETVEIQAENVQVNGEKR